MSKEMKDDYDNWGEEIRKYPLGEDGKALICRKSYFKFSFDAKLRGIKPIPWEKLEIYFKDGEVQ